MFTPKGKTTSAQSEKTDSTKPFFQSKDKAGLLPDNEKAEGEVFFEKPPIVQPKLKVHPANDKYEQEADALANQVVEGLYLNPPTTQQTAPNASEGLQTKPLAEQISTIQTKRAFESPSPLDLNNDEGDSSLVVQQKETGESPSATPALESQLQATKGAGSPLPTATRSGMEPHFSADFSKVRTHTGSDAVQMSQQIGARAFTHGNDIYFNEGEFQPGIEEGDRLLAHELTHTVQQGAASPNKGNPLQRFPIQKKPPAAGAFTSTINFSENKITLEKLYLPKLKERNSSIVGATVTRKKGYNRADSYVDSANSSSKAQNDLWKEHMEPKVKTKVDTLTANAQTKGAYDATTNAYYLKWGSLRLMGSKETILKNALVPLWNKEGKASAYDVDHIKELQLGGDNSINNMELLNFSANRSSGSSIRNTIERLLNAFLISDKAKEQATTSGKTLPNATEAKKEYEIIFSSVEYNDAESGGTKKGGNDFWSKTEIESSFSHLTKFKHMTKAEIAEAKGTKENPIVYTSEAGGKGLRKGDLEAMPGITVTKFDFFDAPAGDVAGNIELKLKPPSVVNDEIKVPIPVYKMDGVVFGGHIPRRGSKKGQGGLETILSRLEIVGLSPAVIDSVDLVPQTGMVVRGRIMPTLDILKGIELDFFIEGNNFGISTTLTSDNIKLPKPFRINGAYLTIGAGSRGIFAEGEVLFAIEKLGEGSIRGKGSSDGNFGIIGKFNFDKKLFKGNKASIEVEYDNKKGWSISGDLEIAKNSLKGVESGSIKVKYANSILEASGSAKVKLKGVEDISLRIKFAEGISEIEGGIKLSKLPGIKEGSGTLTLTKIGDEYDFSGSGTITPDIPGVSTNIGFEFKNDVFLVNAQVNFDKGRLKGMLKVGITNRAVDAEGIPTGDALPDVKVFGSSELQLKITPNITVTAGVKLLETGGIEVRGGIKLPPRLEVVPKLFSIENKPLIKIPPIHIPLFGIPLGVATLGLEAVIKPKLEANVQIGPGSLVNTQAEVVYNPDDPENMTITGVADFEFIAEAGITAGLDFGISISVAIASLTGGINLSAYIKAAAQQPVLHTEVKYSPATGFELSGDVKAIVSAVLGFSGKFYAEASIGVWPLDYTKRWEWPLFRKEIDTGLQIGFEFPFAYKNGAADLSFEKLKFVYPSFDDMISKAKTQIVDPIADRF